MASDLGPPPPEQGGESLIRTVAKLEKINAALMSRVERSMDHQLNAFTLFETAIALDSQVRRRTQELQVALRSLERSKAAAEAANSSKTSFLASVSHDLLQPLNAARLATSALSEVGMSEAGRGLVGQVERALSTLEDLIRTLLDISKLDAGVLVPEPRPIALADLLVPLAQEFAPVAERRGVRLRVRPCDAVVFSEPLMLRRIVQNLISNALRYTRHGGVLVGCRRRGEAIEIQVVDTGPGIPPNRREVIFNEFQRDDDGSEGQAGFGLGLSIVRRLAVALGHPIGLRSTVGKGSSFSVTVPLSEAPVAEPLTAHGKPNTLHYGVGGAFVVLVENEMAVAEATAALLEGWGCDVLTAATGDEAIAALDTRNRRPDLIIADLHLDGGALGYEAIEDIQRHIGFRTPALVTTADHSQKATADLALRGLEMLKKPVKPAQLRSLMAYLLA
ncbi:MAG: hybrid sensor histidine kinase/response regulator [Alsobacter sp.]